MGSTFIEAHFKHLIRVDRKAGTVDLTITGNEVASYSLHVDLKPDECSLLAPRTSKATNDADRRERSNERRGRRSNERLKRRDLLEQAGPFKDLTDAGRFALAQGWAKGSDRAGTLCVERAYGGTAQAREALGLAA